MQKYFPRGKLAWEWMTTTIHPSIVRLWHGTACTDELPLCFLIAYLDGSTSLHCLSVRLRIIIIIWANSSFSTPVVCFLDYAETSLGCRLYTAVQFILFDWKREADKINFGLYSIQSEVFPSAASSFLSFFLPFFFPSLHHRREHSYRSSSNDDDLVLIIFPQSFFYFQIEEFEFAIRILFLSFLIESVCK